VTLSGGRSSSSPGDTRSPTGPLGLTEEQLQDGFAIMDEALAVADAAIG